MSGFKINRERIHEEFVSGFKIQIQSNLPVTSILTSVATYQPLLLIRYLVSQIIIIMRLKQAIFSSTVGLASSNLFKIFSLKKCVK